MLDFFFFLKWTFAHFLHQSCVEVLSKGISYDNLVIEFLLFTTVMGRLVLLGHYHGRWGNVD